MVTTADDIVNVAASLLRDDLHKRWPATTLYRYIEDGLRVLARRAPWAVAARATAVALAQQPRQTLPAGGVRLLEIPRTTDGVQELRPSIVELAALDRYRPSWRSDPAGIPRQWAIDPIQPEAFYVYPSPAAGVTADLVYAAVPATPIAQGADTFDLREDFRPHLVNYVCFRALSEDGEVEAEMSRAAAYLQAFEEAINGGGTGSTG